ncbi:MAG: glycosyltransferase [Planctomycetes bacterium]|nr:glycosyltransferase [Planctomycetota bacterium]
MSGRVAYVSADPGIAPDGTKGASVHFRAMAGALARIGVDLDVFLVRQGDVSAFAPHRARTVPGPRASGLAGELLQLAHAETLLEALRAAGPHAAVYERLSLFGLGAMAHALALGVPFVVEVNAPLWREAAAFRDLALPNAARGVCLDVLRAADRVFAVSRVLADELVREGVAGTRIEVLGNGADVATFRGARAAQKPPALRGRPTLLFTGSLKPWHGIEFLLRAFAALRAQRPCGLWIVGDGPESSAIGVARRAFPGDVVHDGAVPHDRIPEILQAADVVVAPYSATAPDYFSPLKVVEALAAGRPLLASRVPCVVETLAGHSPMGLFAPDDVADFVTTAIGVLDAGPRAGSAGIVPSLVDELDWTTKARHVAAALGVAEAARA